MHVDIHQHVWPDAFVTELRRRSQPPRLDGWTLLTAGEPPFAVNPADHDTGRRARQAASDGVGLAIIGLSSPLGIEYLAPEDAEPLLDAYHRGVAALGAPFAGWAAACLTAIDAPGLARQLDRGFVGLQLPATAVADESGYRRCGALLDVLAERDLPLFIHPGPAAGVSAGGPAWWAPLVPYVQQLHAAWFAFRAYGRPTRGCGSASPRWPVSARCTASAWPPAAGTARWRGAWSIRSCSSRRPATAAAPSTPSCGCSASTCSSPARTAHMRSHTPISASAAPPAMRSA